MGRRLVTAKKLAWLATKFMMWMTMWTQGKISAYIAYFSIYLCRIMHIINGLSNCSHQFHLDFVPGALGKISMVVIPSVSYNANKEKNPPTTGLAIKVIPG